MKTICGVLLLFLLCFGQIYSQECGKVDSGYRGGRFNVQYEQRHLVKLFRKLNGLPVEVRKNLDSYLNKKLGRNFAKKLKFDEGQHLDLKKLKQEFPELYESNLKLGSYDLLFYFSDKANGLKSFYSKLALNEDGSVNEEINLPEIAENPAKGKIIPCRSAAEIAAQNGFPKKFQNQYFEFNYEQKIFVWEIHDRRPTTPDESLLGLAGNGTYNVIQINANTGEVLKKYKYTIII